MSYLATSGIEYRNNIMVLVHYWLVTKTGSLKVAQSARFSYSDVGC